MTGVTVPVLAARTVSAPLSEAPLNGTRSANGEDAEAYTSRRSMDSISENDG